VIELRGSEKLVNQSGEVQLVREIEISTIIKQLGFSSSQVERWQQIQMKSMSQSPEFAGAPIVNLQTQPLIHNASFLTTSESILI
jgi:hypothetical protein